METVLEECITEEQRFLWAKRLKAWDIHKEMLPVYSEKDLTSNEVHNWAKKLPPWWQTFRR
jgi:hypothetical protein